MKPIAFFFTQYTDYGQLIKDQSKITPPNAFRGGKRQTTMNALESMIAILTTPVARRQGVTISAEDCKVWAEELRNYEEHVTNMVEKR